MKKTLGTICASTLILASAAYADDENGGFYAGIGIQAYDLDSNNGEGSNDDITAISGINLTGGYAFNSYFSVEGEAMFGIGTISQNVPNSDDTVEVGFNNGFSGFGRANLPLGDNFAIFTRVGFTSLSYDVRDPVNAGNVLELDDSGLAWGGGLEFRFGEAGANAIRFDFTDANLDALPTQFYGISYNRRF